MTKVFLDIGQYKILSGTGIVQCVLGSCLGIIFYDKQSKYGCFCHGFLPSCSNPDCKDNCIHDTKYVNCAIERMVKDFQKKGLNPSNAYIALIGGGNLIKSSLSNNSTIGELNYESALRTLKKYNLKPTFTDVGDTKGRKFIFNVETGELKVEIIK